MTKQVELEALEWHPYGTGFREVGERYTAPQEDADVLIALGRARIAKGTAKAADDAAPARAPAKKTTARRKG